MPALAPAWQASPSASPPGLARGRPVAALALVFAAGMVDATGFLGFGGVFTAFMSGDTTRLGVALHSGARDAAVLLGGVMALFVVGAMTGRALSAAPSGARGRGAPALAALLLLAAAGAGFAGLAAAALVLAAPAAGVLNAGLVRTDGVSVLPAHPTAALAGLGHALADWAMGLGGAGPALRLLATWAVALLGAAAGAWAHGGWGLAALAAPAALLLLLAALERRSPALRYPRSEP